MSWIVRSFAIIVSASALAACNSNSSNSVPNGGPNASSTTVSVTTSKNAPISNLQVILSTGIDNGQATGKITSDPTNAAGQVTFSNLPAAGQLCVSTAMTFGGTVYRASHCAQPFPAHYTLKFSKIP
jgi:hypothetical protein